MSTESIVSVLIALVVIMVVALPVHIFQLNKRIRVMSGGTSKS
jgi:hypothetical protein